jgi:nicotinamidase-related amidase
MVQETALLIIDMQNDVVEKLPLSQEIVPGLMELLEAFRAHDLPVFHIRRSYRADGTNVELPRLEEYRKKGFRNLEGTPGVEIIEELRPMEEEYVVVKPRWSGFDHTPLELLLKRLGIKTVVITGVQTPNCIRTTAFDAVAYDYDTILVKNCSAAATHEIHEYNIYDMEQIGVKIKTKEEILNLIND